MSKQTKVIAIANQKGGCGKTTTAISIAAGLVSRNYKVMLVDSDPQESSSDWKGLAVNINNETSPAVIGLPRATIHRELDSFMGIYDYIVIDGLSGLNSTSGQITSSAIRAANVVIIPIEPSALDLWATSEIIGRVKDRQIVTENQMKSFFILTRCRKGTKLKKALLEDIDAQEIPVFDNCFTLREDYKNIGEGKTAFNLKESNPARIEAELIIDELLEKLKES